MQLAALAEMTADPTRQPHEPLSIAVTGATGLIGSALVPRLRAVGHTVRRLVRGEVHEPGDISWDPSRDLLDRAALDGTDAVINLAGAPIAQRWTSAHKQLIRDSRIKSTALIARTIAGSARPPRILLSGSAIGIYGDRGDEALDESSEPGRNWLAQLARDWEHAAEPARTAGARVVLLRTGIVLSTHGGALAKLLPPFRLGAGGPLGSGSQWMSWITLDDQLRAMDHALRTTGLHGAVNLVSPNPVTNAAFADALGHALSRPALVPVPAFALRLLFGEMADATILASQRVSPTALLKSGFSFGQPVLEGALRHELELPSA